jgi:predicted DNA-binding ribbon-helix-helix protein
MTRQEATGHLSQSDKGVRFIQQFFDLLPPDAKDEIGSRQSATLGWLHAAYAFRQRDLGNLSAFRRECALAWLHDLRNVRNRGLWSIFVRSLVARPIRQADASQEQTP